jgi:glycerol-3-phosphate dehydrogenase subunit C
VSDQRISYLPSPGMSYDPGEEKYWDEAGLEAEVRRAFEICHGCRMCFKYCDSFPTLFSLIDEQHGGDVRRLSAGDVKSVMDPCFQC